MADREELLRLADSLSTLEAKLRRIIGSEDMSATAQALSIAMLATMAMPTLALAAASLRARAQDPLRAHGGGE